jgi:hypothetical protein
VTVITLQAAYRANARAVALPSSATVNGAEAKC